MTMLCWKINVLNGLELKNYTIIFLSKFRPKFQIPKIGRNIFLKFLPKNMPQGKCFDIPENWPDVRYCKVYSSKRLHC